MIDSKAVIDQNADLATDVTVGPFSVIESDVEIGAGTDIGSHVVIRSGTRIGVENKIYSFASIGEDPQFVGYAGEPTRLEIGDHNIIREYVTLNRGSSSSRGTGTTTIGNHNFIMAYSHVAHDSTLGNHIIFANGASLAGHVEVGDYAILGGFTLVHQFCVVGAHALTGIGTVCLKDVPPYLIVAGNPSKAYGVNVRGLRRRQFSEESISDLKRAYKRLFRSRPGDSVINSENTTSDLLDHHAALLETFIARSDRGVIR